MKEIVLELNWLDIVFLFIGIVSLGLNVVQYVDARRAFRPLKSNLTALFNDIKAKGLFAYQIQNSLLAQQNPHKDIATLKWEYAHFCQAMMNAFQGLQESVVGILVAVDPTDREGKEAFRAATYGLTTDEAEARRRSQEAWQRQYFGDAQKAQPAVAPQAAKGSDDPA